MKQLLLTTILVATISLFGISQTLKFGHIDSQSLLQSMPEQETAKVTLEKEFKQMENNLQSMQVELNKKYEAYMGAYDTLSDFVKKSKEQEMQEIQTRIQNYQQEAQSQLQKKEAELFQPILEKAQAAIAEVGKENGFIYIFDISSKVVLFQSDKSIDVLSLVKKKLGME